MTSVARDSGDRIVVQCIQQCPRGQLKYQYYTDIDSVISFCQNITRSDLKRFHNSDDERSCKSREIELKTKPVEPSVERNDNNGDQDTVHFLSSKITSQRLRNCIDLHRITSLYEDEANEMLLEKLEQFQLHEKKQAHHLDSQFKLIELKSQQKRSADQDYFERQSQKNVSSVEDHKKQLVVDERLRAAKLEQKLEEARKLEKEKERAMHEKLAAAKKNFLRMIETLEKDTKQYQDIILRISKAKLSNLSGDECFALYLQIAKQSYDNMCIVVAKAQTKLTEVSDTDCGLVIKYSQELRKALGSLQSSVDAEEKAQTAVSNKINPAAIGKAVNSNASSQRCSDLAKSGSQDEAIEAKTRMVQKPSNEHISIPSSQISIPGKTPKSTSSVRNTFDFFKLQSSKLYGILDQAQKLKGDTRMEQFLKTVKGACRSLNNVISGNSLRLLIYQKERILKLFQGNTVIISDVVIDPLTVQDGPSIIKVLLAQNFIRSLTRFDCRELALAILLVELASLDSDFKAVLMTSFHLLCPFTRPAYLVKKFNQSEDAFKSELGYTKQLGDWEDSKTYLNRMIYITQLYAAVLTSRPISTSITEHPFGFFMAWQWIAEFVNLPPFSGYSAGLLRSFLTVCGKDLLHQYENQFHKVLELILSQYVKKCKNIADDLTYVGHLENSLQTFFSCGKFFQDCALDGDFWLL